MTHPELDEILDLVRGRGGDDVRRHVKDCAECGTQVQSVGRLDAAGRTLADVGTADLVTPPDAVWDRIQAEVGATRPVQLAPAPVPRRRRRTPLIAAAAAVVGIAVGAGGAQLLDDPSAPSRPVVAAPPVDVAVGSIDPVGTSSTSGTVAMTRDGSALALTVTFAVPVSGPGYVEAWLLDPASGEMIGLGVLGASGGTVTVPAGADLDRFTAVDVSREPFDGDPAHSDESLARGTMRPA